MSDKNYYFGENVFESYSNQPDITVDDHTIKRGVATTFTDRTFVDFDTNISVRSDYGRQDYERFRPSDTTPKKQQDIIKMCMDVYQKVGLVRNVIDLMGDFGSQGIKLQHTVTATQNFYNKWWKKVSGSERSERFLNQLYRQGQVIIKKSYGKINIVDERRWRKGLGQEDVKLEKQKTKTREIPLKYSFINPTSVEVVGGELSSYVGQPVLAMRVNPALRNILVNTHTSKKEISDDIKKLIEKIPPDIRQAITKGENIILLNRDKTDIYYYKKDDWSAWAYPMCHAILDDIIMLNKLKLADISALDGAIASVRLWTLGVIGDSPQTTILPTKSAINKVRNILANNVGGGVLDLVWGPELSFTESNSQIWRWLGSDKYQYTINAIYEGLGIPPSLRGAASGSTNTGNFIGLNTLVKRLQYGRDRLVEFWTKEVEYVHKAMGFPGKPPEIVFDFMALADETAEKQLLINLWDRDIIPTETILELFGRLPTVEKSRVKKEYTERNHDNMPGKASPYHTPEPQHEYKKILLQAGQVTPSEIGLILNERKKGETTRLEQMEKSQLKLKDKDIQVRNQQKTQLPGVSGRPKNVQETKKRKPKPTERPSTKASEFVDIFLWANTAQEKIAEMVNFSLLYSLGKNDMRKLTKEEFDSVERIKFDILCQFEPFEEISVESVSNKFSAGNKASNEIIGMVKMLKAQFVATNSRQPKKEELLQIYSSAFALYNSDI